MLLANIAKSESILRIMDIKRAVPGKGVSDSPRAVDQMMDCFVKGAEKGLNKEANFDYLAYFFADLSRLPQGRKYFITRQGYDGVIPISKLVVFTEHKSTIRRKGVASTIKWVSPCYLHGMLIVLRVVDADAVGWFLGIHASIYHRTKRSWMKMG